MDYEKAERFMQKTITAVSMGEEGYGIILHYPNEKKPKMLANSAYSKVGSCICMAVTGEGKSKFFDFSPGNNGWSSYQVYWHYMGTETEILIKEADTNEILMHSEQNIIAWTCLCTRKFEIPCSSINICFPAESEGIKLPSFAMTSTDKNLRRVLTMACFAYVKLLSEKTGIQNCELFGIDSLNVVAQNEYFKMIYGGVENG